MKKGYRQFVAVLLLVSGCLLLGGLVYKFCFQETFPSASFKLSGDYRETASKIKKRQAEQARTTDAEYFRRCVIAKPTSKDIEKLCQNLECGVIQCVRACDCNVECHPFILRTTCFSQVCTTFDVWFRENHVLRSEGGVSIERLSSIVNRQETDEYDTLTVKCSQPNSKFFMNRMELNVPDQCPTNHSSDGRGVTEPINPRLNETMNIHLIYFRFLSRWESYFKLPRLNALIKYKQAHPHWSVHSWDKMQSRSLYLQDNLHLLLHGAPSLTPQANNSFEGDDLIRLALESGRCVVFNIISCKKIKIYEEILAQTASENNLKNCKIHARDNLSQVIYSDLNNHTFCRRDDGAADDVDDVEDALYIDNNLRSLYSASGVKILSISLINLPDIPSTSLFDSSITNIAAELLSQPTNCLILTSDVGDLAWTRLTESVFLRTQTFNPLLHVIFPRSYRSSPLLTEAPADPQMSNSNFHLISISDVFNLTKALILSRGEMREDAWNLHHHQINNASGENIGSTDRSISICLAERVKGPVECLCQGNHVRFPNDSIQAAFATHVVGNVNNILADLASSFPKMDKISYGSSDYHRKVWRLLKDTHVCDRLVGVDFRNVQHVTWQNSTYVLMTIYLRPMTRMYDDIIRIDAEVEYSVDDDYHARFDVNILAPTKIDIRTITEPSSKYSKMLFHHLCKQPNDLSLSLSSGKDFLNATLSHEHFGGKTKLKSIHNPCLYIVTTVFSGSAALDGVNVCQDRSYNLTVSAQLLNVMSLSFLPVEITLKPRDIRFISSLVKSTYGVSKFAYKLKTSYIVLEMS